MQAIRNGAAIALTKTPRSEHPDEVSAAKNAAADDPEKVTRNWLLQTADATLCTLAAKPDIAGFPFGSVVPFALDATGAPLIYLADMAAHSSNLKHDNRATVFLRQSGLDGDPQKGWRVGVTGRFQKLTIASADILPQAGTTAVDEQTHQELMARYLERVPWAEDYGKVHTFSLWRMSEIERVRYIAGFGKISWLTRAAVDRPAMDAKFLSAAKAAVAHMNDDHADALEEMVTKRTGETPFAVSMVSLDRAGFMVRAIGPDRLHYFSFTEEIAVDDIRMAVVATLKRVRREAVLQ